jgi:hypothetical protein
MKLGTKDCHSERKRMNLGDVWAFSGLIEEGVGE